MDDLGFPKEKFVEFFRCILKPTTRISESSTSFPPAQHGNLLASSSRYGYLFVATGPKILSYELKTLQENGADAQPTRSVDLSSQQVEQVLAISLLLNDSALAVHASLGAERSSKLLLVSVPALARGSVVFVSSLTLGAEPKSFAVSSRDFDRDDSSPSFQHIAVLLASGAVELHRVEGNGAPASGTGVDPSRLSVDAPTCLALGPGDELLAVGTKRGSVLIYDAETTTLRATIVEVESGWVPFAVHFAADDAVLVSYGSNGTVSHVMWKIGEENGELSVRINSALGELCFGLPSSSRSWDGEGEGDGGEVDDEFLPVISCCRVPGWDMCVVASSFSTDVEVISVSENGEWENWKFDEGKFATLPTDADDNDTTPVGIAIDMTDTAFIDAADPSAPRINPMPRLITLSSDLLLLPFSLIDDRTNASNELVRGPSVLPDAPIPSNVLPGALYSQTSDVRREEDDKSEPKSELFGSHNLTNYTYKQPSDNQVTFAERARASVDTRWPSSAASFVSPFGMRGALTLTESKKSSFINDKSFGQMQARSGSESSEDSISDESDEQAEAEVTDNDEEDSVESETHESAIPVFSGTEEFLSQFKYPSTAEAGNFETALKFPVAGTVQEQSLKPRAGKSVHRSKPKSSETMVARPSLPAYPPQPSLIESSAAVGAGKPLDLIKSILLEMREELDYNWKAQEVTMERLKATGTTIMPQIDEVRTELAESSREIRVYHQNETSLRKELLEAMKTVMTLYRDFEAMSLDFRIREEEGMMSSLMAEDKAADDMLARKEAEVQKAVGAIEDRLNLERMPRERRVSQTEQIQQIYSSLSLQGIRIKKVSSLLKALSERIQELDRGGRRSDLGLSLARLEKLSIGGKKALDDHESAANTDGYDFTRVEDRFGDTAMNGDVTPDPGEETFLASKEVRNVLRRLAMRDGRASISARKSKVSEQFERRGEDPGAALPSDRNSAIFDSNSIDRAEEKIASSRNTTAASRASALASQSKDVSSLPKGKVTSFMSIGSGELRMGTAQREREPSNEMKAPSTGMAHTSSRTDGGRLMEPKKPTAASGNENTLPPVTRRNQSGQAESLGARRPPVAFLPPDDSAQKKPLTLLGGESKAGDRPEGKTSGLPDFLSSKPQGLSSSVAQENKSLTVQGALPSALSDDARKNSSKARRTEQESERIQKVTETRSTSSTEAFTAIPPAPLPGDDSILNLSNKSIPPMQQASIAFAALPPDPDSNTATNAKGQREGEITQQGLASKSPILGQVAPTDVTKPIESLTEGSLFAALPPDEDNTNNSALGKGSGGEKLNSGDPSSDAAAIADKKPPEKSADTASSGPGLNLFAEKLNLSGETSGSLFGSAPKADALPESSSSGTNVDFTFGTSTPSPFGVVREDQPAVGSSDIEKVASVQGSTSDESDKEKNVEFGGGFGMDTTSTASDISNPFKALSAATVGAQPSGLFGSQSQNMQDPSTANPFAQAAAGFGSSSQSQPFGMATAEISESGGFGTPSSQPPPANSFTSFGASSPFQSSSASFGAASPFGAAAQFGSSSPIGNAQFGSPSNIGGGAQFGASSQLGAGFGESSRIGGSAPFGSSSGSGFGASSTGFGASMQSPTFGQSSFGMGQSQASFGSAGNAFGSSASPFGNVSGSGFGGQSGGGSGFAALAASGGGFGNGGAPIFGNSSGPPSFTSAAFAQRRA